MAYLDAVTVTVAAPSPYDWDGCWRVRFSSSDGDAFAEALALIKSLPPRQRAYDPERREWRIDPFGMAWLSGQWWALREAQTRARYQGEAQSSSSGARSSSWRGADSSADRGDATPRDVREAFARLHLLPSAPPEVVKAAFRALAKALHPDVGGDTAAMVRVNLAYEQAETWARDHGNGSGDSAA